MSHSDIKIRTFTGSSIKIYVPSIARLRLEVFREYPNLYESDLQHETQYLRKYSNCKEAIVVIVFDGSEIVGAATGLPLQYETETVKKPFLEQKLNVPSFYYFGESLLLKNYRERGISHHFF